MPPPQLARPPADLGRPRAARALAPLGRGLVAAAGGALALATAFAAGACGEVIGLGPERASRASSGAAGVCGLPPHPNPACDACLDKGCCELSWRCYESGDDCAEESQCAVDCGYDTACVGECTGRKASATYAPLEACLIRDCLKACLPSGPCAKIISCCRKIPREDVAYDACVDSLNRNDGVGCQALLDGRLLEAFCPELAPAD